MEFCSAIRLDINRDPEPGSVSWFNSPSPWRRSIFPKPGTIVAGLLWGFIVFRARAPWAVLLMHWALGVSLDFFICFAGKGG